MPSFQSCSSIGFSRRGCWRQQSKVLLTCRYFVSLTIIIVAGGMPLCDSLASLRSTTVRHKHTSPCTITRCLSSPSSITLLYTIRQGFDAACKAIFQCVGGDTLAAVQIFCKWAVPVSWLMLNEYHEGKRAIEPVSIDCLLCTLYTVGLSATYEWRWDVCEYVRPMVRAIDGTRTQG